MISTPSRGFTTSSPLTRFGFLAGLCTLVAALAGCGISQVASDGSLLRVITPYRIDIVQGNAITREQAQRVRPGMSRLQVQEILGTPTLTDPFHAERWDYPFSFRRAGAAVQRRHVVALFDRDGRLTRLDAPDDLPSEREFVAAIAPPAPRRGPLPPLVLTPEQRAALPVPQRTPAATPEPGGPTRTYPPLEP
jgi:outer membrane protein assembly factor BamE